MPLADIIITARISLKGHVFRERPENVWRTGGNSVIKRDGMEKTYENLKT